MTTDICSAWRPSDCAGTADCPPRWPRFIDKRGEPALVTPLEPQFLVFVDPSVLDRGIGTERCRHAIAYAVGGGHDALVLDVGAANERAVHVHRRPGFETVERAGNDRRMRLWFDEPIVETVRLPSAERPSEATA